MKPACLRQTELPSSSKLFTDFLYHYDRVTPYYGSGAGRVGFAEERRRDLVNALRELNGDSPSIQRLAQAGTVAVVTGQQVGLFSGPAYTIYKALTAARHADVLTQMGTPAVPVFWLATEDHDFAEVSHAWIFDGQHRPAGLQVTGGDDVTPAGVVAPPAWPLRELRQALAGHPFTDEVVDTVSEAYQPGSSMGGAFHELLRRLLAPYGFLFVDPLQPAFRKIAAPLMRRAVEAAPELTARLLQRNKDLDHAGYHAQVHIEEKTSLFFLLEDGRRKHLRRVGDEYALNGRRLSAAEMADRAESLSPNATLRPVLQDYVLPTAAYVGGPAELAYFAQSSVLYEQLGVPMPRLISRTGFTLLDSRTVKLMERYKLRIQDFFHGEEFLREKVSAALVPAALQQHFRQAQDSTAELLNSLDNEVRGFDPTLSAALSKSRAKILYQLRKIEAKVAREAMARDERSREDAAYLYNGIFPHKHLQERFYSILPFLARHGMGMIERLHAAVPPECPDHILLPLD